MSQHWCVTCNTFISRLTARLPYTFITFSRFACQVVRFLMLRLLTININLFVTFYCQSLHILQLIRCESFYSVCIQKRGVATVIPVSIILVWQTPRQKTQNWCGGCHTSFLTKWVLNFFSRYARSF